MLQQRSGRCGNQMKHSVKESHLTDGISSSAMSPEVLVKSREPVLELPGLGVPQLEGDSHGGGENVSNSQS